MDQLKPFKRLPRTVLPLKYDLTIFPNFETYNFSGTVVIHLNIIEETNIIELHSLELNLTKIEYKSDPITVLNPKEVVFNKKNESVEIHFSNVIKTGQGVLKIEFNGVINDNLIGFYKTKCINRNNQFRTAAVTQFEAAYARRAFPCFDEPSFKAKFDITLIGERSKTFLSNMPLKSIVEYENDSNLAKFQFESSIIMSTYLVAYIIGDYDYIEGVDELGTLVRVYTPVGKSEMGKFSLEIALKALPFFSKYFGIKYPLPKLDLIALADVEIG